MIKEGKNLLVKLAEIGRAKRSTSYLSSILPFKHFFNKKGRLIAKDLDEPDGKWNRREVLSRCLLLSAVLEQGPDIVGVDLMLTKVVNDLYKQEIRIFHRPLDFFKEIGEIGRAH